MKLIAHYDIAGKIRSVVAFNPLPGISLALSPVSGEHVAEIDGHGLTKVPSVEKLRELARGHSVVDPLVTRTIKKVP